MRSVQDLVARVVDVRGATGDVGAGHGHVSGAGERDNEGEVEVGLTGDHLDVGVGEDVSRKLSYAKFVPASTNRVAQTVYLKQ